MNVTVFATFWLIVLARIIDVSLDTIRMVSVVQGRRAFAAVLGFFEAVVYICAVAKVLLNMNQPVYALGYGLGFATGTYLGMAIEQREANEEIIAGPSECAKSGHVHNCSVMDRDELDVMKRNRVESRLQVIQHAIERRSI